MKSATWLHRIYFTAIKKKSKASRTPTPPPVSTLQDFPFPSLGARARPHPLPHGEGRSTVLLARGIHVADSKVLGDLLHVFRVKEGVVAGFVWRVGGGERRGRS